MENDTWYCPGCHTQVAGSEVRDHVSDCDLVDGAGRALPVQPYYVTLTMEVQDVTAQRAARQAAEDMRVHLRRTVLLEVRTLESQEPAEVTVTADE
jgi:hypothetical protein